MQGSALRISHVALTYPTEKFNSLIVASAAPCDIEHNPTTDQLRRPMNIDIARKPMDHEQHQCTSSQRRDATKPPAPWGRKNKSAISGCVNATPGKPD